MVHTCLFELIRNPLRVRARNAAAQAIEEAVGAREAGTFRKEDVLFASSIYQLVYSSVSLALTLTGGSRNTELRSGCGVSKEPRAATVLMLDKG